MRNNIKLKDVVEALKILYKYIEFKKVLDHIFPVLSQNIIKLSSINIYNFENILSYVFKSSNKNIDIRDFDLIFHECDLELDFNKIKHAVIILKQFAILHTNVNMVVNSLSNQIGIDFKFVKSIFDREKMEDFDREKMEEEEKDEEIDEDKQIIIDQNEIKEVVKRYKSK